MEYISKYRNVENQGSNSMKCTGFSLSCAMEIGLMMQMNTLNVPDLSPQFIYYNSKLADNKPYTRGTPLNIAVEQLIKHGVCEDYLCPFNDKDGDLLQGMIKPSNEAYSNAKLYRPIKLHRIFRSVDAIKEAILIYGSVATSMVYGEGMFSSVDGFIKKPSTIAKVYGSHSTAWIGWSDENKCFIQVNSYGVSQGVNGLEYIPYDCVENDDWYVGRDSANRVFQYCYAIEFGNLKNPNFHLEHQPKEVIPTEPSINMELTMGSKEVMVNGVKKQMLVEPLCINGNNLVPMRFIFKELGYDVIYTPQSDGHHSIVAKSKYTGRVISMSVGYRVMYSNNETHLSPVAPIIHNGNTLIPLRMVSEMAKCKVDFDNSTKKITITR